MHVYSLIAGGLKNHTRAKRNSKNLNKSVAEDGGNNVSTEILEIDGISVKKSPGQEKRTIDVKFSLGPREGNPASRRTTVFMNSDPLSCNFEVEEFDEDFIHNGKIVDDNGRMSNQVFALIFKESLLGGTDVEKIFATMSNGRLVIYSPDNSEVFGVTFDDSGTDAFVQWIDQVNHN